MYMYYYEHLVMKQITSFLPRCSGILGELSVMVQASPMVRDRLGPALLHTYAAVKVFEGLDVDKEDFDKYAARYEISQLLHRLWGRQDCRESILRQCGSKKFQVHVHVYMYYNIYLCVIHVQL